MPPGLAQALGPVLEQIAEMTLKIKQYDREIQQPKPKGKVTDLKGLPCLFLHGVLAHRKPASGKNEFYCQERTFWVIRQLASTGIVPQISASSRHLPSLGHGQF
jgi:hypothetical protein